MTSLYNRLLLKLIGKRQVAVNLHTSGIRFESSTSIICAGNRVTP